MYTLLQLSDLHFGDDHFFTRKIGSPSLAEAINTALDNEEININHLVFSGDFFSKDQANDKNLAVKGITEILEKLQIPIENISFVPGNHDISWDSQYIDEPFHFYNELVDQVGAKDFKKSELPNVLWLNKEDVNNNYKVRPIFLALLNSCIVEGEIHAGIGDVGENQLKELNRKLKKISQDWRDLTKRDLGEYTLIVCFHHHLLPIHDVENISEEKYLLIKEWNDLNIPYIAYKARSSHTLDAVDILNQLAKLETSLIIHGHQHKSAIVSYQNKLESLQPLTLVGSGSCSSKESENREFFVYQIDEHEITIKRFIQSGNARRFEFKKSETNPIKIHLPHISRVSLKYCVEEAKLQHSENTLLEASDAEDVSNLNLLLLSVASCEVSRKLLREFFSNHKSVKNNQLCLQGMYDLLGHWDLLARFRLNQTEGFDDAKKQLTELLKKEDQMNEQGDFSDGIHINVTKETHRFRDLLARPFIQARPIKRNIFENEDDYNKKRCQRGFLFISLPPEEELRRKVINALANLLDDEEEFISIVEGIYEGTYKKEVDKEIKIKHAVVIEVFMTCAQSLYLNHINKAIEKKLAEYRMQKYTMFCYGYDEKEIVSQKATA